MSWSGSQQYWTGGSWDGKAFEQIPESRLDNFYNFSYVTNENESYFTYSDPSPSLRSRFVIDVFGQIQTLTWLETTKTWNLMWFEPRMQCEVYALCGSFGICREPGLPFCNCLSGFKPRLESEWNQSDFSSGCLRKNDLQCAKKPNFLMITVKNLPPDNSTVAIMSRGECHATCSNDCSSNAYSIIDNKCLVWDGDLLNLSAANDSGKTIYVKVGSQDLPNHNKSNLVGVVSGSTGGVLLVLGLVFVLIYGKRVCRMRHLAPEWLSGVAVTAKADVYSYGMMLFELVHGKRNAEQSEDPRSTYFPSLVANVLMEEGDILSVVDNRLNREVCVEQMTKICKVACWCIQEEEASRPTIRVWWNGFLMGFRM
ncbi:hypothetical protein LXL04_025445 [Taraxacum kok-saghyz]